MPPVVHKNTKQTVFNMLLGFPQLILNNVPLWTQFEYAKALFPTVALIELGYYEALDAAVAGDPGVPDPAAFGAAYGTVIAGLRSLQAQVIATTIPNTDRHRLLQFDSDVFVNRSDVPIRTDRRL